ncbi:MAG: sulfotransferase [Ornithinimicrobium sp.]
MSEPIAGPVADDQLPPAEPGWVRRGGRRVLRRAVDAGVVGQRLRTHVVICGFPRSGSTLLQLMIDSCVAQVDSFSTEVEALWAAQHAPRRRPWLVTKLPADVEQIPALRDWYAEHPGSLRALLTVRDPRSVLTSRHAAYPPSRGYYVSPERWRRVDDLVSSLIGAPDVTVVHYEDLVGHPEQVQHSLCAEIGWSVHTPFGRFHEQARPQSLDRMTQGALGGLRQLDSSGMDAWQAPEHKERLAAVLTELPDLPDLLVERGYADNHDWTSDL